MFARKRNLVLLVVYLLQPRTAARGCQLCGIAVRLEETAL